MKKTKEEKEKIYWESHRYAGETPEDAKMRVEKKRELWKNKTTKEEKK